MAANVGSLHAADGFTWQKPSNLQQQATAPPDTDRAFTPVGDDDESGQMTPLTARPIETTSPFEGISPIRTVAHEVVVSDHRKPVVRPADKRSATVAGYSTPRNTATPQYIATPRNTVPPRNTATLRTTPPSPANVKPQNTVRPVPPSISGVPVAAKTPESVETPDARSLFRSLRGEVPVSPEAQQQMAAEWDAASDQAGTMQVNEIFLTTGTTDDVAPSVEPKLAPVPDPNLNPSTAPLTVPQIPQPLQSVPYAPDTVAQRHSANWISEGCDAPDTRGGRKTLKRLAGKNRPSKTRQRSARIGGRFIEFYDPEFDMCPDDYNMPVLLVAARDESDTKDPSGDSKDETANGEDDEDKDGEDNRPKDEVDRLLNRKLTDIRPTLDYAWGDKDKSVLPDDFHKRMDNGAYEDTVAPRMVLQWAPTNLWYHPLYFEDPGLERYGHTHRPIVQPFVSTGRFLGQVAGLPYQMTLHPPHCPEYALGYYQPGECAPKLKYQIPFNEEATAVEFLCVTALVLLIP